MHTGMKSLFWQRNFSETTALLLAAGSIPVWMFVAAVQLQAFFR